MARLRGARVLGLRRFSASLAVVALAACGGSAAPEFQVQGVSVSVRSDATFTQRQDFPARIERTLAVALHYWGGSWSSLEGVRVVFDGGAHVTCSGEAGATGCYQGGEISVTTSDAAFPYYCVEETVLVHEVGHAVIGDPDHTDPRWMDFASVMEQFQGLQGYAGPSEVPCPIFVSVWRHPPNR